MTIKDDDNKGGIFLGVDTSLGSGLNIDPSVSNLSLGNLDLDSSDFFKVGENVFLGVGSGLDPAAIDTLTINNQPWLGLPLDEKEREISELRKEVDRLQEKIEDVDKLRKLVDVLTEEKNKEKVSYDNSEDKNGLRFNVSTGKVFLLDKPLGELKPGNNQYWMFKILWEAYDAVVSYADLIVEIRRHFGVGSEIAGAESNYCQKIKSSIKKNPKSHAVASLIEPASTPDNERGFRLKF